MSQTRDIIIVLIRNKHTGVTEPLWLSEIHCQHIDAYIHLIAEGGKEKCIKWTLETVGFLLRLSYTPLEMVCQVCYRIYWSCGEKVNRVGVSVSGLRNISFPFPFLIHFRNLVCLQLTAPYIFTGMRKWLVNGENHEMVRGRRKYAVVLL